MAPVFRGGLTNGWSRLPRGGAEPGLQTYHHAFGGGADSRVVIARVGDDFVDNRVGMVGVMMVKNELFRAAFHGYVDGLAPVAVSPAAAAGGVVFGKILRVVDQYVGAFRQLANAFVEFRISRLVVGGVHKYAIFRLNAESKAALRMVQPLSLDSDSVFHVEAAVLYVVEVAAGAHLIQVDREVRR